MESRPTAKTELGLRLALAGFAPVAFLVLSLFGAGIAPAREKETEQSASVPCAILSQVGGEVDVLDSSRTHLLNSAKNSPVPCGGWVSVGKGFAELRHRDGFVVHADAGTFVQWPEPNPDGKNQADHAVLFRGELFAQAGGGSGELRVITANARARFKRGSAILVYNQEDEETQLIALDAASSLENRFENSRLAHVQAGEATSLNFKQMRVIPSAPRAVALAALKPKFDALRVPERDRKIAVAAAQKRQERIFATALVDGEEEDKPAKPHEPARGVASASVGGEVRERLQSRIAARKKAGAYLGPPESYAAHVEDEQSAELRGHFMSRIGAGEAGAERLVAPPRPKPSAARGNRLPAGSRVEVVDLESNRHGVRAKARKLTEDDEEKLRLIEELSRIREE